MNDLEVMKLKLNKLDSISKMTNGDLFGIRLTNKEIYEKMGLFETLQIKSLNMYGYKDTIGFQILYNRDGLYGWGYGGGKSRDYE